MGKLRNILIGGVILASSLLNPIFGQKYNSPEDKVKAENSVSGKVLSIHFPTGGYLLSNEDSLDIKNHLNYLMGSNVKDLDRVDVTTYTDMVGEKIYNKDTLGLNRGNSLAGCINFYYPKLEVQVASHGEVKRKEGESHKYKDDRKGTITPYKKNDWNFAMRASEPDSIDEEVVYLIDISGSTKYCFDYLRAHDFKGEIWVSSKVDGKEIVRKIDSFEDFDKDDMTGRTSYYLGAESLFSQKRNKRVKTIFNDEDNIGGCSAKSLVEIAKENNLIIDNTAINPTPRFKKNLEYISHMTGGNYIEVNGH